VSASDTRWTLTCVYGLRRTSRTSGTRHVLRYLIPLVGRLGHGNGWRVRKRRRGRQRPSDVRYTVRQLRLSPELRLSPADVPGGHGHLRRCDASGRDWPVLDCPLRVRLWILRADCGSREPATWQDSLSRTVIHFSTPTVIRSCALVDQRVHQNYPQVCPQHTSLADAGAGVIGACSHAGRGLPLRA